MKIADSSGFDGAKPAACSCATFAVVCQSSLAAMTVWSDCRTSESVGFASGFAMPYCVSDGPVATIATLLVVVPLMMKPPISTSLPVPTRMRVEMLPRRVGWFTVTDTELWLLAVTGSNVGLERSAFTVSVPANVGRSTMLYCAPWPAAIMLGRHCTMLFGPSVSCPQLTEADTNVAPAG